MRVRVSIAWLSGKPQAEATECPNERSPFTTCAKAVNCLEIQGTCDSCISFDFSFMSAGPSYRKPKTVAAVMI